MLQASLKVIGGKNDGKLIQFKSKKFLVGREQDCHLRPNSDLVSRHHCVFTLDDYTLRLRDLGSTNGTLVNGRRIRGETVLTPGDVVRIGKLNLEVVIGDPVRAETAPPIPNLETTSNASALDTAYAVREQTTLEDSTMIPASSSSDTAQFEIHDVPPKETGSDAELPLESDTSVVGMATDQTLTDHPVAPTPVMEQPFLQPPYMPEGMAQAGWQYPPQYAQYPQYQQYMPPGYPMYPGYPPGYGYPPQQQPGQYPPNYQQPAAPPEKPAASSGSNLPDIRLPNPEDTGAKDVPKPAAPQPAEGGSTASTPSQRAAELLNSRRRRNDSE